MRRRLRLISLLIAAPLLAACSGGVDVQLRESRSIGAESQGPTDPTSDDDTTSTTVDDPDVPDVTDTVDPDDTDVEPSSESVSELSYQDAINLSIEDIKAFWQDEFPGIYGDEYADLEGGVWAANPGEDLPGCGTRSTDYDTVRLNAFYCPLGDFIMYDDESLFPQIYDAYGPFVLSTILAHEWGHAIQYRAGVQEASITMEQQADCFAGAWTRWIADGNSTQGLSLGEDQEALNAAMAGFIEFKDPAGLVSSDQEGAHGSAFDRVSAFRDGYNNGGERCATYPQDPPPVFEWPYLTTTEAQSEGNMPYEDLLGATLDSLDRFWLEAYQATGADYASLAGGLKLYGDRVAEAPTCGGDDLEADLTEAGVFYCSEDDYIGLDETGLALPVYEIGDFAVSLLIGNAFANRAQEQLGLDVEGKDRSLQADCLSGAWVKDIYDRAQTGEDGFRLSPGDLDEGVTAFLRFGDQRADELGTPFERVDSFRTGFLEGLDSCGI